MDQLSAYVQDSPQESSESEDQDQVKQTGSADEDGHSSAKSDSGRDSVKRLPETNGSDSEKEPETKKSRRSMSKSSGSNRASKSPGGVAHRSSSKDQRSPHRHRRHHSYRHSHHKDEGRRRRHHHRQHRSRSGSRDKHKHHRRHHHSRHSPKRHDDPASRDRRDRDIDRASRRHRRSPGGRRSPHRHGSPPYRRHGPPAGNSSQRACQVMTSAREQELNARAAQAAAANEEVIAQHKLANALQSGTVDIGALQAKDLSMTDIARLVKQNVKCNNATPQEALEKTFAAMQEKVAELTGVKMPSYYNPAAVNPLKFAQQEQKRKLLWSKAKDNKEENTTMWSEVFQSSAGEGKSDKMRRLMGIRGDVADVAPNVATEGNIKAEQQLKKQDEVFNNLDKEYELARVSTHLNRGVGLGFSSQFSTLAQHQMPPTDRPGPSHK